MGKNEIVDCSPDPFHPFMKTSELDLLGELLTSLPAILVDEDDGIAEAKRRSKELDDDPASGCSWEEIKRNLGR